MLDGCVHSKNLTKLLISNYTLPLFSFIRIFVFPYFIQRFYSKIFCVFFSSVALSERSWYHQYFSMLRTQPWDNDKLIVHKIKCITCDSSGFTIEREHTDVNLTTWNAKRTKIKTLEKEGRRENEREKMLKVRI